MLRVGWNIKLGGRALSIVIVYFFGVVSMSKSTVSVNEIMISVGTTFSSLSRLKCEFRKPLTTFHSTTQMSAGLSSFKH